jgi:hypothetical protein
MMTDNPVTVCESHRFSAWADANWRQDERALFINYIARNSLAGAVMPGTGGLRKMRWSMPGRGKRGGARVIYYYHDGSFPLMILAGYAKSERADLTPSERAAMRAVVEAFKELARNRK